MQAILLDKDNRRLKRAVCNTYRHFQVIKTDLRGFNNKNHAPLSPSSKILLAKMAHLHDFVPAKMFTGTYTAIVTPFKNGKIDEAAFGRLIKNQIQGGVDGIVPVGTTGE